MPISYSVVYDETGKVMAECPKLADATPEIAKLAEVLKTISGTLSPSAERRRVIEDKTASVRYCLLSNGSGRIVGCTASIDTPQRTCFALIEAIVPLVVCKPEELRNGKKLLQMKMDFYNKPENDKIAALAHQIDEVTDTMVANVELALQRGDLIDVLNRKSVTLSQQSHAFAAASKEVKQNFLMHNLKNIVLLILGLGCAALLIAMISCHPNFSAC